MRIGLRRLLCIAPVALALVLWEAARARGRKGLLLPPRRTVAFLPVTRPRRPRTAAPSRGTSRGRGHPQSRGGQ